jgi:hypothetical protein
MNSKANDACKTTQGTHSENMSSLCRFTFAWLMMLAGLNRLVIKRWPLFYARIHSTNLLEAIKA